MRHFTNISMSIEYLQSMRQVWCLPWYLPQPLPFTIGVFSGIVLLWASTACLIESGTLSCCGSCIINSDILELPIPPEKKNHPEQLFCSYHRILFKLTQLSQSVLQNHPISRQGLPATKINLLGSIPGWDRKKSLMDWCYRAPTQSTQPRIVNTMITMNRNYSVTTSGSIARVDESKFSYDAQEALDIADAR